MCLGPARYGFFSTSLLTILLPSLHLDQPSILPVPSDCGSTVLLVPRLYPSRGDPPCQHRELSPLVYQTALSTSIVRHPCPASPPPECELPCPETLCLRSFCPEHSVVAELRRRCLPYLLVRVEAGPASPSP